MSKFNIGDMVRVRDWEDMVEEYGFNNYGEDIMVPGCPFVSKMKEYCGNVYQIIEVNDDFTGDEYQLSDCDEWVFNNGMLHLVARAEALKVEPIQANILFDFSNEGVRVVDEFAITNSDNAYDYTTDDKKKMIQALADYFNVEINFLTRNCSTDDEMEDVPLEIINNEEDEPYNGKVVCIKHCYGLTEGKIYDITEGTFFDDNGELRPQDLTHIQKDDGWFTGGWFIPLV